MAVYKIFPEKTATLFSFYPNKNTGLDEILDISLYNSVIYTPQVSRALIQFPTSEIQDVITNKVSGSSYNSYLKLYLADASAIPLNYALYCYPIYSSWNMGTGRTSNLPETTDGVSWAWRTYLSGSSWVTGSFPTNVTASYSSTKGGGDWYYNLESTQSFNFSSTKDIELNVTNTVVSWSNASLNNNGFILKHNSSLEFSTSSLFETKYFSGNTHTIYPPCLEIRWNDFIYNTGSLSVISSDKIVATLGNNKGEFNQDSIQRFRVNVRDKYPIRTFQTSSVYLNNKVLPTSSYWSIIDLDSEEIVIDYDTSYTKISADSSGNYFDIYMNGLQPERYYKILIKTIISGSTLVLDDNYYFKVTE